MMEIVQNFTVEIEKELNDKLRWFTCNYENEIGGWLTGEITEDKIIIKDLLVPRQEVSSGSVDTEGKALIELRKEYGDRCLQIIGHWHSHNTMSAFWSHTDETFMETFTAPRGKAVFIVSSKKDGHLVRFEMSKPIKVILDSLNYEIIGENKELIETCQKIIKDKVIERQGVIVTMGENAVDIWADASVQVTRKNKIVVKDLTPSQYEQIKLVFMDMTNTIINKDKTTTLIYKRNNKKAAESLSAEIEEFLWAVNYTENPPTNLNWEDKEDYRQQDYNSGEDY